MKMPEISLLDRQNRFGTEDICLEACSRAEVVQEFSKNSVRDFLSCHVRSVQEDRTDAYPALNATAEKHVHHKRVTQAAQVTEWLSLLHLSEFNALDELLQCQLFSCGKCRSFSVSFQPLYSILKKIERQDAVAEILLSNLRESTSIEPCYFDLLDQPDETRERILGDDEDYYDMQDVLKSGNFIIEDEVVYEFPYEECSFVFDANCSCNRILRRVSSIECSQTTIPHIQIFCLRAH